MTEMSASDAPHLVALGRGVFAYLQPDGGWGLNNAGILVGSDGVTLIDTAMTRARTERLRDAAASVGDGKPVRTIVNTHHHPDHTNGNGLFPTATIVAHEACRTVAERIMRSGASDGLAIGPVDRRLPDLVVRQTARIFRDEEPIDVLHFGAAHSLGDLVLWFPERKLLFAGDLIFAGATPLVMDGSIRSYFATIAALRALGAETIVCGHGVITDASCLDPLEGYLRFVQDVARDGFAAERSPLALAQATDLGAFASLAHPERLVANLYRAFAELRGEPDGAPVAPIATLFAEMGAYLGRPLEWRLALPCLAGDASHAHHP
jgi:cyclase